MWKVSATAGLFAFAQAIWIVATWRSSRRTGELAPPDDAGVLRANGSDRRASALFGTALLLTLAAVTLAVCTALDDARGGQLQLAWVVALPGTGALCGLALALTMLAHRPQGRRPGADIFLAAFSVAAFGCIACYGVGLASF